MKITEVFSSIQGEGKYQGRQSIFIRFPNCNLACKECDTPYTWKSPIEMYDFKLKDLIKEITKNNAIVFTGGEPLLKRNLNAIKDIINLAPFQPIEIETNGTIEIEEEDLLYLKENSRDIIYNISPKINFPQEIKIDTNPIFIKQLQNFITENGNTQYIVKFLFENDKDLNIIKCKVEDWELPIDSVYVQPIGIDSNILREKINNHWDRIMDEGWNISLRSHIFLFENKRNI